MITDNTGKKAHLFEGFGIELEYMIVRKETLDVLPVADELLRKVAGEYVNEIENGPLGWSNEFAMHVVELKTLGPRNTFNGLAGEFQDNIGRINDLLQSFGACLMPAAMHPWMDPAKESKLWPHSNREIYEAYDNIFTCQGHGWTNLQSVHLNLAFGNDTEFGRLHTAIRLILPLLPALAASSPIVEGKDSGLVDARLEYYRHNQRRVPSIAGAIIPEAVLSREAYEKQILQKIYEDIKPHDPKGILQFEWLNSRGAIARFDRNAIEIRLLDIQECPLADVAIATAIIGVLKALVNEKWSTLVTQASADEKELAAILLETMRSGEQTLIADQHYLGLLGFPSHKTTAGELWDHLIKEALPDLEKTHPAIGKALATILRQGPLARRLLKAIGSDYSRPHLADCYRRLCACLAQGEQFLA